MLRTLLLAALLTACSPGAPSTPNFETTHAWLLGRWSGVVYEGSVFVQAAIAIDVQPDQPDRMLWSAVVSRIAGQVGEPCPERMGGTVAPPPAAGGQPIFLCTSDPDLQIAVEVDPGTFRGVYQSEAGPCIGRRFTIDAARAPKLMLLEEVYRWPDLDLVIRAERR